MARKTRLYVGVLFALAITASVWCAEPHWSFKPRRNPTPPPMDAAWRAWPRTDVDPFILKTLLAKGLRPAPEAERNVLVRRLYFDLTGLPPTPADIDEFSSDPRADAYERLVERLLASPRYGERWAQHWLDVVRYAESDGFEYDRYRPGMWRYRDYVIKSFQKDKPYDRFIIEQIAGDELEPGNEEMQIAVGFHRLGPVRRNAGNQNVASSRNEVLTEMTDAVGMVVMGLTVGCARCHDHKFDDFTQEDYYRLQAFMATANEHNRVLADKATQAAWESKMATVSKELKRLKAQMAKASPAEFTQLEIKEKELESRMPSPLPAICTVQDGEPTAIHVLKRGVPEKKGERVEPGFPSALAKGKAYAPVDGKARLELARWLADPNHPLTARVFVNRVWQYHFGRGLVETPNDFGVNGAAPSHPELLDYLANEFVANGMKLRPLHRMIVLSATYRQSSHGPDAEAAREKDQENRLLWQFPRRRLSAEEIRDGMLAVSARLNLKPGGESVVVPVERDLTDLLYDPTQWRVTPDLREHDRRSIFLLAKRNLRLPFSQAFDQPDLQISCPRRETSTHALQALELMNGKTANRLAEAFAERLKREAGADYAKQVEVAYRLALGRAPNPTEKDLAVEFLRRQPLREFALAVFNLNGFLYVE